MPESNATGYSSLRWFLQRLTAVILLVCLLVHVFVLHFSKEPITFEWVIHRVQNSLFWGIFYLVFLGTALFHGLNGVYGVILDYAPAKTLRKIVMWGFWIIGLVSFAWGIRVLILFLKGT